MRIQGGVVIENEAAYARAVERNIIANANKTFARMFPDHEEILSFVAGGRIESDRGVATYKDGFLGSLARAYDTFGKLSEKQVAAVRKAIAERTARRAEWADKQACLNASRKHLGTVGEKITLTLTIKKILLIDSQFGTTALYICEDADRNVVIYKGNSKAFSHLNGEFTKQDDVVTVLATVSAHGVRDGVKQTIILRPKKM